ncbi:hypothetical protein [Alicyclobacillus suci]|uniref:hypothetical protein n=1 Tax=Alicyclobacillus suci TaxID=2816080 RepID=UPI001A8D9E89|nr:hypothetical protein [Alicyclobacillus suci]
MKTIEGILRYDPLDTESWCFDMGYQSIPTNTGMAVQILVDGRFLSGRLLETVNGGMIVRLVGSRKDRQWSYVLEPHRRYSAKMAEETVERILDEFRLLDLL